jgi:hypothetical protein
VSATGVRLRVQTTVTWDSVGGLQPATSTAPISSVAVRRPDPLMRRPIRIRPASTGDIDLLIQEPLPGQESAAVIARSAGDGGLGSAITLQPPVAGATSWRIDDFVGDRQFLFLLETVSDRACVRKVNRVGDVLWIRWVGSPTFPEEVPDFHGAPDLLLTDGMSGVFFAASSGPGRVVAVADDGSFSRYAEWGDQDGPIFMDRRGNLHAVRYLPDVRRRAWASFDPHSRRETVAVGSAASYAALANPLGAGPHGEAYAVDGWTLTVLHPNGETDWSKRLDNIVVTPDGTLYVSAELQPGVVSVERWTPAGEPHGTIRLPIPAEFLDRNTTWRVIDVDDQHVTVSGGATSTQESVILRYLADGTLVRHDRAPAGLGDIGHELQTPATWVVDSHGTAMLPVLGPTGVSIVGVRRE